ncbi:MAG: aldehyde dehydrogenase family protein [Bacillales bacterium]
MENNNNFENIRNELVNYFKSNITLSYAFRIKNLKILRSMVKENLNEINLALKEDLNKDPYEVYLSEISLFYSEINYLIKNLKKLMKKKIAKPSFSTFPASTHIINKPYGLVLIMSPWNYPLQLSLVPLAGAIAGGNVVILKMSEYSVNTTKLLTKLIEKYFKDPFIKVVNGDKEIASKLLDLKYDKIFFTGSTNVGKVVLSKANKYLTPCLLELGGKSPVIILKDADIKLAAKKIIWGKILNAGQTCVAPDYVLIDQSIKDKFIQEVKVVSKEFFDNKMIHDPSYPKIINEKHYQRLKEFIINQNIIYGGEFDDKLVKISLTLILNPSLDSKVMNEEIFGPILPLITFNNEEFIYEYLNDKPKPLALYIFSNNKKEINNLMNLPFGGCSINDTILHMSTINLPFGGIGESGIGDYHGIYTYKAFTHEKPIFKANNRFDISLRYHPYKNKIKILKKLFK